MLWIIVCFCVVVRYFSHSHTPYSQPRILAVVCACFCKSVWYKVYWRFSLLRLLGLLRWESGVFSACREVISSYYYEVVVGRITPMSCSPVSSPPIPLLFKDSINVVVILVTFLKKATHHDLRVSKLLKVCAPSSIGMLPCCLLIGSRCKVWDGSWERSWFLLRFSV